MMPESMQLSTETMTMTQKTCSPPPLLPPTRALNTMPKPEMQHANPCHDWTTHWFRASFDPVFQAIDCLAAVISDLSDKILKATLKNVSTLDPKPQTPNPNQQSHHPQPHCHRPQKPNSFLHPPLPNCHPSNPYMILLDNPSISMYC